MFIYCYFECLYVESMIKIDFLWYIDVLVILYEINIKII